MFQFLFEHELHCHHNQGHMVMPCEPPTDLIIIKSTMLFRFLEGALDPVALSLSKCKTLYRSIRGSIAQRVFEFTSINFPANNQMPLMGRRLFSIPKPYSLMKYIYNKLAFGCLSHCDAAPAGSRRLCSQKVDTNRRHARFKFFRSPAPRGFAGRNTRFGIFDPNHLILADIRYKNLAHLMQATQEGRILPIKTVAAHPTERDTLLPIGVNHFQGQIMLTKEFEAIGRHTGCFTTFRILDPIFRQIQPAIDRCSVNTMTQNGKNSHLAVIYLADGSCSLSAHAHRLCTLLEKSRFIDQQTAVVPTLKGIITAHAHGEIEPRRNLRVREKTCRI